MNITNIVQKMTLEEKCYLLSGKDVWRTRSVERLGISGMMLSDGPHGIRKQEGESDHLGLNASVPATCYPTAATIANSWDVALGREIGEHLGMEAVSQGISVLLGPGMNIKRNPLCGRNFEYFSEDPYLAGKMAAGYILGIQSKGVAACPKHFAANSQELLRMTSDSVVDERTLREIYLTGFEIAVKEGHAKAIMSAYNRINGVYANENEHLLQEILRDEWGFEGFVVSDWGASNDHTAGVAAGSHLEMPTTGGDSDEELMDSVKSGKLSEELLNRRVEELLTVIMEVKGAVDKAKRTAFDVEEHHRIAQKAAERSIVLLKNENQILPLKKGTKVALIGDFAKVPRYQGAGSSMVNPTKLESTLDVIDSFELEYIGFAPGYRRTGKTNEELLQKAAELAEGADVVLLYIGLDEISESEGMDRDNMKIPENQIQLLKRLTKVNSHIVVVLSGGAPIEMDWIDGCEAVIHGYLSGQAGAAAMLNVIVGNVNPSGKLSETYPMRYEDVPSASYYQTKVLNAEYREGLYVGYRYFETVDAPVRFPFGFGLSYTTFEYSNLKVSDKKVTFTLKNTGDMDGAEVVQLYISARCHGIYRPKKELKGFTKVFLKVGQSKEVTISFDDKAFRYFNCLTNKFEVEGGEYEVLIGASSRDIRLKALVSVKGTDAILSENAEQLPDYFTGKIKKISDEEFAALLGHAVPEEHRGSEMGINDTISQMCYAKGLIARFIHKILTRMLDKSMAKGKPDLNILFIYNMPFRGIGKMSGGMCSQYMVEGIVKAVNGHLFRGIMQVISGYFRQRKVRKKARGME